MNLIQDNNQNARVSNKMNLIQDNMTLPDYTLYLTNKMEKSSICARVCSEETNIFVNYLGTDFRWLKFIFEGSRYLFEATCVSGNKKNYYSLWYSARYGRPFLNDYLHLESCYGYLSFLGRRILCISKCSKETLKIEVRTANKNDIFICKNKIIAEVSSNSALKQTTMQSAECFQIMINKKSEFDLRILLLYIVWKIIDNMDIYSCGI